MARIPDKQEDFGVLMKTEFRHETKEFTPALTKKLEGPGGGALVFKIHGHAMQKSAWPDLQVYSPHLPNCMIHMELKCRRNKASGMQRDRIIDLRRRGTFAYVVRAVQLDLHFEDQDGDVEFVIENWQLATGIELMQLITKGSKELK